MRKGEAGRDAGDRAGCRRPSVRRGRDASCRGGFGGQGLKERRDRGEFPEAPHMQTAARGPWGRRGRRAGEAWGSRSGLGLDPACGGQPVGRAEGLHAPTWAVTGSLSLLRGGDGAGGGGSRELPAGIGPWARGLGCVWREKQCSCSCVDRSAGGGGGGEEPRSTPRLWSERLDRETGQQAGPGAGL